MQLISIEVNNFRQYYGKQKIQFARGEKNVTIIFGENGKGKTGIFRALIFGIFGDRYINQDNKNDEIHLVNFNKLEENEGTPVETSVEVIFDHNGKEYIVKRVIVGYKIGNNIKEENKEVKLAEKDGLGNYKLYDELEEEEKNKFINNIFDSKIKDFFLFDAEKIDTLAKTNKDSKKEVEDGIKNLLNIHKLQRAIDITKDLIKEENKNISKRSNDKEVVRIDDEIENLEKKINEIDESIDKKKNEESDCSEEISKLDEKLSENQGIKIIQDKINEEEKNKLAKKDVLNSEKNALKEKSFTKCHMLLMEPYYEMARSYLKQIAVKQKDLIPLEVIEKSLNEKICSCCKVDLQQNIDAYNEILKLKENFKRSELTPLISLISNTISDFLQERDKEIDGIKIKLEKIRTLKENIDDIQDRIDKHKEIIKEKSNSILDLKEIENSKNLNEENKIKIQEKIRRLEISRENHELKLKDNRRKKDRVLSENTAIKFEKMKLEYAENLRESLEKILDDYSDDMREKLMLETTNIFKMLIDVKDKELISKILINKKYEIEVINRLDTVITQDISQGQRQIVALSFITALAKVAGGEEKGIDFPLFMDTPFGRVSGINRDNLIENIPKLAKQWILLLTDTEFTINEEKKMKEIGKLGKWFKLNQKADGYSKIEEVNLDETMATRG